MDDLSLWEYMSCVNGWRRVHGDGKETSSSEPDDDWFRQVGIDGF